jgi:NAD+ kinase
MSKNYHLDKRTLICATSHDNVFGDQNFGLNEFTVNKLDTSAMMMIEIELNNNFFSNYWADGLIISTPTGSTAYSLSCGGPVITPQCSNFVITPIAPHSLSVRPVVISDQDVIKIRVKSRSKRFLASLDSNFVNITTDAEFEIRKADFNLNLIRLTKLDYMSTLRSKLLWGSDARNTIKFAN